MYSEDYKTTHKLPDDNEEYIVALSFLFAVTEQGQQGGVARQRQKSVLPVDSGTGPVTCCADITQKGMVREGTSAVAAQFATVQKHQPDNRTRLKTSR